MFLYITKIILIKEKYISLEMGGVYFCCTNQLDKEQQNYLMNTFNKIKNTVPAKRYENIDNKDVLNIEKRKSLKMRVCMLENIKFLIICGIILTGIVVCSLLGMRFGSSFILTVLYVTLFAFIFVIFALTRSKFKSIKKFDKIIFNDDNYVLIDNDGLFSCNDYSHITGVKKVGNYAVIENLDNNFIIISYDEDTVKLIETNIS